MNYLRERCTISCLFEFATEWPVRECVLDDAADDAAKAFLFAKHVHELVFGAQQTGECCKEESSV